MTGSRPMSLRRPVWRWGNADGVLSRRDEDSVVNEEPLEIRVEGRCIAMTMRTPGHDEELAAGFLLTEGLISRRDQIVAISPCLSAGPESFGNIINVFVSAECSIDWERLSGRIYATASCGICGKSSVSEIRKSFPGIEGGPRIAPGFIDRLSGQLRSAQIVFSETGGIHAAGLFGDPAGLRWAREDIGRHNAVDKVIGRALLDGALPLSECLLLVSGRVSFEIMQKSMAAGVPIVAAVSAPSSLAVDFAVESGQTLIGFLREGGFNVYSHRERLAL